MMEEILYLEPDEEITSVIDKLKDLPGSSVALVLPKHAQLATSVVNLRLLQAEAKKRKKTVAIVTQDKVGMKLAAHVGIPVYASVTDDTPVQPEVGPRPAVDDVIEYEEQAAPAPEPAQSREPIEEPVDSPVPVKRYDQPARASEPAPAPAAPIPTPTAPAAAAQPVRPVEARRGLPLPVLRARAGIALAALAVLLGIGAWWLFVGSWHGRAVVALKSDPYETKTTIVVDNSVGAVDEQLGKLPGQRVETDTSKTSSFPSTGKKDVGTKASGTVTVSNRLGEAVTLPANTRFERGGLVLLSTEVATIPAASVALDAGGNVVVKPGTGSAHVEAASAGEQYNLAPGDFSITSLSASQREKVSAANQAAFAGGASKSIQIVTAEDIDHAKQAVIDQTKDELVQALQQHSPALTILKEGCSFDVVESSTDKQPNDESDTFSLTAKVRARAVGFVPADYQQLVVRKAQGGAPAGKQVVTNQQDTIDTAVQSSDVAQGQLTLTATLHSQLVAALDTAALASQLAGKTVGEAQQLLGAQDGVVSATVSVAPSIRSSLPTNAAKITIELRGQ